MLSDLAIVQQIDWLSAADPDLIRDLQQQAVVKNVPKGTNLAFEGAQSDWFFVLRSGRLRVYKLAHSGREVTLYHVQAHESCVLTIFSILSRTQFPAFAVAETDLSLMLVPAAVFKQWVDRHALWREHVFQALSCRLQDILATLDKVTFRRVDVRIADYLLRFSAAGQHAVEITHEKLANEVGSSRVGISRILEAFDREGLVRLSRGEIEVLQPDRLREKVFSAET